MRGIIFLEFLRFAAHYGVGAEQLGAPRYRSGGNYDVGDLIGLIERLSATSGRPVRELVRGFGHDLFHYFAGFYPSYFSGVQSALEFLARTESHIHKDLLKLHPAAEFPRFTIHTHGADRLEMVYRSRRGLADLAEGIMHACAHYFGEELRIAREDLPRARGEQVVRFTLTRVRRRRAAQQ
jgi:hypothetical protein